MLKHEKWTQEEHDYLVKLKEQGYTYQQIADELTTTFNQKFTFDGVRNRYRYKAEQPEDTTEYKETIEHLQDGSQRSDRLIKMSVEQSKNTSYLLKAHGYDPNEWEIINAKSSIWNQHNKTDGTLTLYASKITVKPKTNGMDWEKLIAKLSSVPSVMIKEEYQHLEAKYLNVPLFDMHFGPSTYEKYKETQHELLSMLDNNYSEVLLIIGQDLLHTDDFRGRTASGREIGKIDLIQAWNDAARFYEPIIVKAIKKSKTKIMYSKGNHDESMSWAFVQYLKGKYPQATYDDSFKERKVHMLGSNFIGVNHGDKKKDANLTENFSTEFPIQWANATTREIFTGHLHHERVLDKGGAVIRRMPTGNEIDDYHDDYGYTTAHKRFQVFEYTEDKVKRIHYV